MFIKRKILQLINQCDDKSTKQGTVTLDDIRTIIDEIEGDIDREFIIKCAKESSENAIQNAFDNELSVTILEGNDIVKKYNNGMVEIVKHL